MSWSPYRGEDYWDFDALEAWCRELAAAHPAWVTLEEAGQSRYGRPMLLLTLGNQQGTPADHPAFWLDGGTHASEWTGVMATLYCLSEWVSSLADGDPSAMDWFSSHTVYVMPCISPDGYQAIHDGAPFLRSTLRPPPTGTVRTGFSPKDMDGDGAVRWMRWRDPGGPFVADPDVPLFMRPRTVNDDPADAWFLATEGEFLNWDGVRWTAASLEFGLDLNRNFPSIWKPFSMFGMDGGAYPMSEPESRCVVETFSARPNIGAVLTNHTYTGALLSSPYRADDALPKSDLRMMKILGRDAIEGTDYRLFKIYPEFMYDDKVSITGVWDDAISSVFGVLGYTLELWDPFRFAGVENKEPAKFFADPDQEKIRAIVEAFSKEPGTVAPWTPFAHPQLGAVEIGGLDYLRTIRNPPLRLLAEECARGFTVADHLRKSIPKVTASVDVLPCGEGACRVRLCLENTGFLPTSSLQHGADIGAALPVSASLSTTGGLDRLEGAPEQDLGHLDGWGSMRAGASINSFYSALPERGHRGVASWLLKGSGELTIQWQGGRGGRGTLTLSI